jgi:hypothetical protein
MSGRGSIFLCVLPTARAIRSLVHHKRSRSDRGLLVPLTNLRPETASATLFASFPSASSASSTRRKATLIQYTTNIVLVQVMRITELQGQVALCSVR